MALPEDSFRRPKLHSDARGCVFELLRLPEEIAGGVGQLFITTADPGQSKGHHYHTRKTEWFCVIAGEGEMVTRHRESGVPGLYPMKASDPLVVRVVPGVTHALRNTGTTPLVAAVFVSEVFNPEDPDTFEERLF